MQSLSIWEQSMRGLFVYWGGEPVKNPPLRRSPLQSQLPSLPYNRSISCTRSTMNRSSLCYPLHDRLQFAKKGVIYQV